MAVNFSVPIASRALAQRNELATDPADRQAVVLTEIRDGLEIRTQTASQPHQFDVALSLPLEATARLDAVQIVVDVKLEQRRWVVCGSTRLLRLNPVESKGLQIELRTPASAIRRKLLHVDSVSRQMLSFCTQVPLWDLRCSHVRRPVNIDCGGMIQLVYFGVRLTISSSMSSGTSFAKLITNIWMKRTCDGKSDRKKG